MSRQSAMKPKYFLNDDISIDKKMLIAAVVEDVLMVLLEEDDFGNREKQMPYAFKPGLTVKTMQRTQRHFPKKRSGIAFIVTETQIQK